MSYPSIITQPGSAARNAEPITEALSELLDTSINEPESGPSRKGGTRRILEIGSGDCTHLKHWARKWDGIEWYPTGRNEEEVKVIGDRIRESGQSSLENIKYPLTLDIGLQDSWTRWEEELRSSLSHDEREAAETGLEEGDAESGIFNGVIMINIIHCCPPEYPEQVFRHFSTMTTAGNRPLLDKSKGWIAVYAPFLADDGSYKSEGDEKFDKEYIRAKSDSLGLRTIGSISAMAEKWGFREMVRKEMPKGNMWVVWGIV